IIIIISDPSGAEEIGTSELILDTDSEGEELGEEDTEEEEEDESDKIQGLKDEGLGLEEEEEVVPDSISKHEGLERISVLEVLGVGVEREGEGDTFKVGQSSRSMPEHEGVERIFVFRQPTLVTWVDPEDDKVYIDVLAYAPPAAPVQTPPSPEWSLGSLLISPLSPVVPSPIASPVATSTATISVDEDQFIERYMFRSLEHEQERTIVMFGALWRPMLTLEAWAGHHAAMQRMFREMRGRVDALE
ncbi:hypothetical protein Tco_0649587, partial [Tanacetum coccineum]